MEGPPVVLVHGLFGWGESSPLFGLAPPYFPLRQVRELWPKGPVVAVDVGAASSDHDRACEAFAQLMGIKTDYGCAHAERCRHARFGPDFSDCAPRLKRWDAAHPVHLLGHSFGGNTAVALLSLLAEDFWGVGTSGDWVLSVTCICSPLRGCSLVYAVVFDEASTQPGAKLALRRWSPSHLASIASVLFLRAQVLFPWLPLKGLYDLRSDHWGTQPLSWKTLVEGDHPYWHTGDNVAVMSTPRNSQRTVHSYLRHLSKTRLVAVMADPLEPLSPGEALGASAPYMLAALAAVVPILRIARTWRKVVEGAVTKRRAAFLASSLLAVVALLLRDRGCWGRSLLHWWKGAVEYLAPWMHGPVLRPGMRLLSHAVHRASGALAGSDRLATRCGSAVGNDGLIDLAAQRWLDAPLRQSSRGRPVRGLMQRCVRSTGQELDSRPPHLANCFSQADVRGEQEHASPLEPGKWRVMRVPGADHALGTSFSGQSLGMYRSVFELLATVSRQR